MNIKLENNIIFEDNHLLVVNKPAGWLSQSDGSRTMDVLEQAKAYIKEKYNKPGNVYLGLVHRLDRNVSGVMVLARTSKAAARLSGFIRNHDMKKEYITLVEGQPNLLQGTLTNHLIKDKALRISRIVSKNHPDSQLAKLEYKTIQMFTKDQLNIKIDSVDCHKNPVNFSLIQIKLITGRFHQIRIQMAQNIAPVVGDKKYKSKSRLPSVRLCLHCCELSFPHPVTNKILKFRVQVPENWDLNLDNKIKNYSACVIKGP